MSYTTTTKYGASHNTPNWIQFLKYHQFWFLWHIPLSFRKMFSNIFYIRVSPKLALRTIPNYVQNIYSGHCVLRLLCVLVLKRDFLSELFTTIGQCQLVWFPFAWSLFKDSSSWQKVLLFFTVSFIFDCCQVSRIMYRLRCIIILPSEI